MIKYGFNAKNIIDEYLINDDDSAFDAVVGCFKILCPPWDLRVDLEVVKRDRRPIIK